MYNLLSGKQFDKLVTKFHNKLFKKTDSVIPNNKLNLYKILKE